MFGIRISLFFVGVFGTLFLPVLLNNAAFASDHSISLSTSGDINIDAQPDESTIHSSNVNVVTTCKAGYSLMLSTSGNDNRLYLNGDSNSVEGTYFNPSDGNTTLDNAANTWGYALDVSSDTTPTTLTPPTAGNVFLPVPIANATPASIRTISDTASDTNINDNISIYYGVNATYDLVNGSYYMQNDVGTNNPGELVYYATMNPICDVDLSLSFNENLDGAGAQGSDNTIVNFPAYYENTADVVKNTVTLSNKVPARSNYVFTGWNTEADGSGMSYQPGAVIGIGNGANELTGNVTLYATWEVGEAYTVTLNFNEQEVSNVEFRHANYAAQKVAENGGMAVLRANESYNIIINYENGYKTNTITTTANGTIDNNNITVSGIPYTITGNDTITITSLLKTGTTTLVSGQNFNKKIKTLAEGQSINSSSTASSKIKALKMASFLPSDFVASSSNTVSASGSPVYIFFDNTNDAGIMYFYTEAHDVYMNVTSMSMFEHNTALTDISALSNWNTSNLRYMNEMFQYDYSLTDISPLSNWNTGSVTDMRYVFYSDTALTDISPLSNWNTGSVTNMSSMFSSAYSLTDISPLSNWNTGSVTTMSSMFSGIHFLTDISPLSNWNTSSVTSMSSMFSSAYSLTDISPLSNWNTSSVTSMSSMFYDAYSLTNTSALSNWNTSSVTNMSSMFSGAHSLTNISGLSNWNTGSVTNMSGMFNFDAALADISALSNWNTGSVTDMSYMFYFNTALTDISPLSNWNTSSVKNMSYMFQRAYALTDVSAIIDDWDIGTVTATAGGASSSNNKFYYMFNDVLARPNFSKRLGTWNSYGTFVPASGASITVTVDLDDHIKAVSFTDSTYGTRTVTKDGGTIVIPSGVQQNISVSYYDDGYTFDAWSITNGTIGSTSSSTTTLTATADTMLTVTSALANTSTVTISPDAHFSSIVFKNPNYDTLTITSSDINNNNNTVTLVDGINYDIIVDYENGYKTNTITTTANGTIGNATVSGLPYTIVGNDTLTITGSLKTGTTTLTFGSTFNGRIKTLAEGKSTNYNTASSKIKALKMASFLPSDFVASSSNTVSASGSPVYIFFDNTNDAGIMYFYTEAHDIYMNASSSNMFQYNTALTDISALSNWNTGSVTDMSSMFNKAYSLASTSALSNWNTGSVTTMSSMFGETYSLADISGLSNWNTSSVTSMGNMFYDAYSLTNTSALSNWNTGSVTSMSGMFTDARSLANVSGLSNWNTSSVTDMSYMFFDVYSLTNTSALSNWNTGSVTSMSGMFTQAYSLANISGLSNWNTGKVTDMSSMFSYVYCLADASAIDNWDIRAVTATAGSSSSSSNKFNHMFREVSTHPNFTMRAGTWDSNGTFIPSN